MTIADAEPSRSCCSAPQVGLDAGDTGGQFRLGPADDGQAVDEGRFVAVPCGGGGVVGAVG